MPYTQLTYGEYLGDEYLDELDSVTSLTPPSGARSVRLFIEAGAVRVRGNGENPTSTAGEPWAAGAFVEFESPRLVRILETEASSVVTASYYA